MVVRTRLQEGRELEGDGGGGWLGCLISLPQKQTCEISMVSLAWGIRIRTTRFILTLRGTDSVPFKARF